MEVWVSDGMRGASGSPTCPFFTQFSLTVIETLHQGPIIDPNTQALRRTDKSMGEDEGGPDCQQGSLSKAGRGGGYSSVWLLGISELLDPGTGTTSVALKQFPAPQEPMLGVARRQER